MMAGYVRGSLNEVVYLRQPLRCPAAKPHAYQFNFSAIESEYAYLEEMIIMHGGERSLCGTCNM